MPGIRIELFGGFRVEVDGMSIPEEAWRQRKPAALVKLLALAPRHKLLAARTADDHFDRRWRVATRPASVGRS
jgi:hypothetical protein